jgi:hypothetical protein
VALIVSEDVEGAFGVEGEEVGGHLRHLIVRPGPWTQWAALRFVTNPVGGGGLEELGDGDALAADEEFGSGVVGFVKGGDVGEVFQS